MVASWLNKSRKLDIFIIYYLSNRIIYTVLTFLNQIKRNSTYKKIFKSQKIMQQLILEGYSISIILFVFFVVV